ncbi:Transglutaminase elicitor [Phytophthora cactorum]|nr:Transglutaminase elicitor [Phytophthora cactorum]
MGKHKQSFILDVTAGAQVWNQPVRSYKVQTMELVDNAQASQQYFGTSTYPFNAEMVYLAYVNNTVSWIVEAYADGPLASTATVDTYTVSDNYEYLLELDANYAIIGAKPDASSVTSTGLSYANVKELLELSVSCATALYAVRSFSENGSAVVASSSGATETTAVATDTSSSKSSSGSTIAVTAASLPSGLDTLIITPETSSPSSSTTSDEESTVATDAPIDNGYYTAPPTTAGQDLADVLDAISTTDSSTESSSQQESSTVTTTITTDTVHNSCH